MEENSSWEDSQKLANTFKRMIKENASYFFDTDEFEDIIEHFIIISDIEYAGLSIAAALEQYPNNATFLLKKAQLRLLERKYDKALDILDDIEGFDVNNNAAIQMLRGNVYSAMGKHKSAILEYKKAINEENEEDVYLQIAFEYESLKDFQHAIVYLQKALDVDINNVSALYDLTFCFEVTQTQEKGIYYYQYLLEDYPYNEEIWYNLGGLYTSLELYEKAIEAYDFAITIDEGFISAYLSKANIYQQEEKYQKAIITYKEVRRLQPNDPSILFLIAENYTYLDMHEKALFYYQACLKIDEKYSEAYVGIAIAKSELKLYEEALTYIDKALELEPENSDFWAVKAFICYQKDDLESTYVFYEKAFTFSNVTLDIFIEFADILFDTNDYLYAVEIMHKANEKFPRNFEVLYRLAGYYLFMGDKNRALPFLEEALNINSLNIGIFYDIDKSFMNDEDVNLLIQKYIEKPKN